MGGHWHPFIIIISKSKIILRFLTLTFHTSSYYPKYHESAKGGLAVKYPKFLVLFISVILSSFLFPNYTTPLLLRSFHPKHCYTLIPAIIILISRKGRKKKNPKPLFFSHNDRLRSQLLSATSKFDLSSSSPDGPTYINGQRGPYEAASMERSGSFREGMDSRIPSSLPSTLRSGLVSSQVDTVTSLQSLLVDLKAIDQKLPQTRDLEMGSIVGISSEESLPATFNPRLLTSSSMGEIKRTKSTLHEGTIRARDRAKACSEAALKIDKYCHNLSKKRSRADISSNERSGALLPRGSISKTNPQSHLTSRGLDLGPQKSEERSKTTVPNRRIRTSMVEVRMDVRAHGIARPSAPMNKDRDASILVNDGMALSEEKGQELATGVDGWEKSKMKKKRSVIKSDVSASAALTRLPDADREPKRGMQQKFGTDARPRVNNAHGFRPGPGSGVSGVGTLDSASQQSGLGMHPLARNDQDNGSLSNDRRDRLAGLDKDGSHLKAVNKPNGHEDNFSASPTSMIKVNAPARGPRSNSGSLSKASPNIHRVVGNSDDWEPSQSINKISSVGGAVNHRRGAAMRSSSPPVQWGGQRPQKISRSARRSNFSPLKSSHDETPASDTVDNAGVHQAGLGLRRLSSNASQQIKLKGDSVQPTGLSESEEFQVADNKSRDNSKKYEENMDRSMHKFAGLVLPSRKKKVVADEDIGDGVRRLGRIGRAFAPTKSGMAGPIEKPDNTATVKQQRSTRVSSERIESKPGRPPTRKLSERKGCTQPRHSVNNAPLEFFGQSDDDHEELLAAANAALHIRCACSSLFWKQIEPIFGLLSSEDLAYLDPQICCMNKSSPSPLVAGNNGHDLKGDLEYISLPSTPAAAGRDYFSAISDGISFNAREREPELAWETEHVEPFLEQLIRGIGARSGVSICQALLSAIIEEEEIENINYNSGEEYLHGSHGICFEVEGGLKSKGSNFHSSRTFLTAERGPSNGFKGNAGWRYHDELTHEKLESSVSLSDSSTVCTKFQYNQMCINDRILLELSEIGLYPDPVPDLAQSEDEDINDEVNKLEQELHEEVRKKKNLLLKLEKAVMEARESQQRVLERIALDRLVEMAYEKYVAYWGPNASSDKNVNKLNKHAALAFVKRTLARCKKFEESGTSCFDEPPFRDMFLSVSSYSSGVECIHTSADGEAANRFTAMPHPQSTLADSNPNVTSKTVERVNACDKYPDAFWSGSHSSEQTVGKEEQWSNQIKKRGSLLDDVVGSTSVTCLRTSSGLGSSLVSGIKGKRSERDREGKEQNRDAGSRNTVGRIGRPALSNAKGERKNKTKPKQKTAQLSASVNSLLSKAPELPDAMLPSDPKSRDMVVGGSTKKDDLAVLSSSAKMQDRPKAIDLSNLQLSEVDVGDLGGHGQDIGSWLNIVDEDGLQDHDYMGLQIPMDDLSEVNMMI
uniref:Uncharacterized protein LOC105057117 isoform X3 n=2 Tax=Elaeis guineensis var. tenera TaxID=51953 RepID=A0A8N4IBK5_ELAGV|nr:uncharacterized protein LOC105057117 isoform X3 [Elaeis guineensis]